MANDLYKRAKFNDGEGINLLDVNDAQDYLSARVYDQLFEKLVGSPNNSDSEFGSQKGAGSGTQWAYALQVGGANPRQGTANNKVKIAAGTLLQKVGTSDGNAASLLAYTFDGTLEFTLANGHATLSRVDLIQMKLEYEDADSQLRHFEDAVTNALSSQLLDKKRRVKATVSVLTGTPATSPVYPTPTAGYVPIAAVVVGVLYVGAGPLLYHDESGAEAVLHDLRMPINIKPNTLHPHVQVEGLSVSTADVAVTAFHTVGAGQVVLSNSVAPIYFPITLNVGDVMTSWEMSFKKNTSGANTVTVELILADLGIEIVLETFTDNSNSPGDILYADSMGHRVVGNFNYYLRLTPSGTTGDRAGSVVIYHKPYGVAAKTRLSVTRPCGRLVGVALSTALGTNAANTTRLVRDYQIIALTPIPLADISAAAETSITITRKLRTLAQLEANAIFDAGPTVLGNGTHNPPIWGNGKRCYEESFSLGVGTVPQKLGVRFEQVASAFPVDVHEATFYMAEGL